jgi:hypothetical protein
MSTPTHAALVALLDTYKAESEKFNNGAVKAAGSRAKRALRDITKMAKVRKDEIHTITNPEGSARQAEKKAARVAAKIAK